MKIFCAAGLAAFSLGLSATAGPADIVTLSSPDGSVEVSGEILSFDGEFYRIDSEYGVLTLDASGVTCDGTACPDPAAHVAEITVSGARVVGETLIPALVAAFAARKDYALRRIIKDDLTLAYEFRKAGESPTAGRFTFRLTGSAEGFADLIAEEADIAISVRDIGPDERRLARTAGLGDLGQPGRSRILALDALVPIVSVANPVRSLTLAQLRDALSGKVTNWQEFGGPDAPIEVHLPSARTDYGPAVAERLLQGKSQAGAVRHDSAQTLAAEVAANPYALGVGAFSELAGAAPLSLTGPCGFSSVASVQSLKTEDYPLSLPLQVYIPARRLPRLARDFLSYATSPAAQSVIRRAGFADQFPETIPLAAQGKRFANAIGHAGGEVSLGDLQNMVRALKGLDRLTLTFRFENGSTLLDPQSRSNVALLASALERGAFNGRRLVFVGFSDAQGPASINVRLSRRRAEAVREAVQVAMRGVEPDRLQLDIAAFGEALPMVCDGTEWGRRVNRRVEVWLE